MEISQTFLMIKPDGVRRNLVGPVLAQLAALGFVVVGLKAMTIERARAEELYAEHKGKEFFDRVVAFTCSGPVVVAVLEREEPVAALREALGATDSRKADPASIRGRYRVEGMPMHENIAHASADPAAVLRELRLFFRRSPSTGWYW